MTTLEIVLSWCLLVAVSAALWMWRFMCLHRDDAAFYKNLWLEERQLGTDIIRAINKSEHE